jgi:hypothetical protein
MIQIFLQGITSLIHVFFTDINGNIPHRTIQISKQQPALDAAAAAQLHDGAIGPEATGNIGGVGLHDGDFGPGQVVLFQIADLIEKLRTPFIVKILGQKLFPLFSKALQHIPEKSFPLPGLVKLIDKLMRQAHKKVSFVACSTLLNIRYVYFTGIEG